jgi:hypothetical protein
MRTITELLLLVVAAALLSIQQQSSLAFPGGEEDKNVFYVGKQDTTTDILELLSGIFAAILFVLSLRNMKQPLSVIRTRVMCFH